MSSARACIGQCGAVYAAYKKRFILRGVIDIFHRIIGDRIRVVEVTSQGFVFSGLAITRQFDWRKITPAAHRCPEEMLEPACLRCLAGLSANVRYHIPFTDHSAGVSAQREALRNCGIAPVISPLGILAGQKRLAARVAFGFTVIAGKAEPAFGQPINVRRVNFTSVTAEIRIPQIVGQDDNNIGFTLTFRGLIRLQSGRRHE